MFCLQFISETGGPARSEKLQKELLIFTRMLITKKRFLDINRRAVSKRFFLILLALFWRIVSKCCRQQFPDELISCFFVLLLNPRFKAQEDAGQGDHRRQAEANVLRQRNAPQKKVN